MPVRSLPSAATGGLTAALVSQLLQQVQEPRWDPTWCPICSSDSLHWPSILVGVLLGLVLAQLLDLVVLFRQWLHIHLRHRGWLLGNSVAIKQRLA